MNFVTTVSDVVRRSNGNVRSLPLDLWPVVKPGVQLAGQLRGSSAEGLLAISSRSRARSTSGITGIFLDASIAMGCSDERHQLRLT